MSQANQVYTRAVPVDELTLSKPLANGGRTITGRLVPYNTVADVLDFIDGKPEIYREGFREGAFNGQVTNGAANKGIFTRIGLIHRHEGGLGYLGPCIGLRSATDGLYGDLRVLPTHAANVQELLEAGVRELSIEFRLSGENPTSIDDAGVRWRTSAHLDQVALEPKGAYTRAEVLAYRSEVDALEAAEHERERTEHERSVADDAEAQRLDAERKAAEEAAEHMRYLRQRWTELDERFEEVQRRQGELVKEYGITKRVTGFGSVR